MQEEQEETEIKATLSWPQLSSCDRQQLCLLAHMGALWAYRKTKCSKDEAFVVVQGKRQPWSTTRADTYLSKAYTEEVGW